MNQNPDHAESTYSSTTGSRIPKYEAAPAVAAPRVEGQAAPPAPSTGYARDNSHLPPSEKPVFAIDASKIGAGVAAFLKQHDRQQADVNGQAWRMDAAKLDEATRRGEITASEAEMIFRSLHPHVSAEQLQRGKS
jgi:hypothetical protein